MKRKYDLAIFLGDFNPFHYGHISVLMKASQYVNRILLHVIEPSKDRRTTIAPPLLDRKSRQNLVKRYLSEGYLNDVGSSCEIYRYETPKSVFDLFEDNKCAGIYGSDVFNYNRFRKDEPQYREFSFAIEICKNGLIVVERPGFPADGEIVSGLQSRGYDIMIVKGECKVAARDIRGQIRTGKPITGMVPADFENDILEMYKKLLIRTN